MKTLQLTIYALAICGFLFLNSCASISGFSTGKTVGKGNGEISMGLNVTQAPNFFEDEIDTLASDLLNFVFVPSFEIGGRYGATEKLDFGIKANTLLNFLLDAKYQLIGDQESEFALSVGAGFGGFGIAAGNTALLNFQIPVYTSFHPKENLSIYVTPRFIGQFATGLGNISDGINYFGGNAGILFGTDTKFGLDFGYYNLKSNDADFGTGLINVGIGVSFKL